MVFVRFTASRLIYPTLLADMTTRSKGQEGEEIAVNFLRKKGYKIIEQNFHSRVGEIDIVALDPSTGSGPGGNVLVFVEVKTRWSKKFGEPVEAVTPWKLNSIIKTAQYYKLLHPELPEEMRIDVVSIELEGKSPKIEHIVNAGF